MQDSTPNTTPPNALAALASGGPQLSGDLPQQVSYSGQNYLELRLDPTDFVATAQAAGSQGAHR